MCEWLCADAWCDVRLVCGGRALPAHRSVLASVSPFLKNLLLQYPVEDSPVFIVLPDFDLDAMSSVLYYIYNGEVTVEKHKIEMFLDIVNAMNIYIDYQYLPQSYSKNNNYYDKAPKLLGKQNVFTTKSNSMHEEKYIKIKKGQLIEDILTSLKVSDVQDCSTSGNETETNAKLCANLQFGGRQRSSFLRDLYIESYPRNGKANGVTASVLAISNERYRGPTSVFPTNVNDKHLDAALPPLEITSHSADLTTCLSIERQRYQVHCPQNYDQINQRIIHHPLQMSRDIGLQLESFNDSKLRETSKNYSKFPMSLPDHLRYVEKSMPASDLAINSMKESKKKNLAKVPILNHVLDSPWCPRRPINFKPSHKKCDDITRKSIEGIGVKEHDRAIISNDDNNNLQNAALDTDADSKLSSRIDLNEIDSKQTSISTAHFKCTTCDQVFTTADSLASHSKRHAAGGRYNCAECGKSFSQLRNYKYHMSVHRGTREFAATCSVCGKYFNDRGYLSSHMKIHRNRKEYKCSMCPKSFNQRVAYNMHVRIHTGIKPHVCAECGKAFSRKMLLKQHLRTHSGERPYACAHCDKRFADRSNMTLHLRLHTGVKPFSCMLCPKSFTKKHHLKSHVNFHTGAKPYSCPRCQLAFSQSSNMRTHLKKCTAPTTEQTL